MRKNPFNYACGGLEWRAWERGRNNTIKSVCYLILGLVEKGLLELTPKQFDFLIGEIKAVDE